MNPALYEELDQLLQDLRAHVRREPNRTYATPPYSAPRMTDLLLLEILQQTMLYRQVGRSPERVKKGLLENWEFYRKMDPIPRGVFAERFARVVRSCFIRL